MATCIELIYEIKNGLNRGRVDGNPRISDEQIKFKLNYYRGIMARRYLAGRAEYRHFEQKISEIQLEEISDLEVESYSFTFSEIIQKGKAKIYKTVEDFKLPVRIRIKERPELEHGITYLGVKGSTDNIPLVDEFAINYAFLGKHSGNIPRAFISEDSLYYVISNKDAYKQTESAIKDVNFSPNVNRVDYKPIDKITVRGIFENPFDVPNFTEESIYPIPNDMTRDLVVFVISDIVGNPAPIRNKEE